MNGSEKDLSGKVSLLILLAGFNGSGKTTLAKKLEKDLQINIVSGDPLRLLLKNEILYYQDFDISIPTEKGRTTREIVRNYRNQVTKTLLGAGQSVIYDSSNMKKEHRKKVFSEIRNEIDSVKRIIVHVTLPEEKLLERLEERPEENWAKHHKIYNKPAFEIPTLDEADIIFEYNQENYEEIKNAIAEFLD